MCILSSLNKKINEKTVIKRECEMESMMFLLARKLNNNRKLKAIVPKLNLKLLKAKVFYIIVMTV